AGGVRWAARGWGRGRAVARLAPGVQPSAVGVVAAVPRVDAPSLSLRTGGRGRLHSIPGQVPAATAWPDGCRFHPRCPYAWDRCRAEEPPLLDASQGDAGTHTARCWLVTEPQRRTPRP